MLFKTRVREALTIRRWEQSLSIARSFQQFQALYADVDGFALSRKDRTGRDAMEYVYGEIQFKPFIALLSLCNPDSRTVFYDLGSGTGKAVLAAAMVFPIKKSCGIELFPSLYQAAERQKHNLKILPEFAEKASTIVFRNENFLDADLHDATLLFINATAFFGETWRALNKHLLHLPADALLISTSKPLCEEHFVILKQTKVAMSWGIVDAFIQQSRKIPAMDSPAK
jgi:SAM-dependent methyltransferase